MPCIGQTFDSRLHPLDFVTFPDKRRSGTGGFTANIDNGGTLTDICIIADDGVKKTKVLPIECVVRGYLAGSGLKEYNAHGTVCGVSLPKGLRNADRLPEPIFTPSTKADVGHDENIDFARMTSIVGTEMATRMRDLSLAVYQRGVELAAERGILLADTKFEFGLLENGELILIDEVLTPDSSRYWLADSYQPGSNPPSLDKQFLRDYLETLKDWNKQAPAPVLPEAIIQGVLDRYLDLAQRFGVTV